jgi:chromosome segregation ATPase
VHALEQRIRSIQDTAAELTVEIVNRESRLSASYEDLEEEWHRLKQRAAILKRDEEHLVSLRGELDAIVGQEQAAGRVGQRTDATRPPRAWGVSPGGTRA